MGCPFLKRKNKNNKNNFNNNINTFSSNQGISDLFNSYKLEVKSYGDKNNIVLINNTEIKNTKNKIYQNKNDIIISNKICLDKKEKTNQGEILNKAEIENLKKEKNELIIKVSTLEKEKEKIKEQYLNLENKNKEIIKKLEKEKEKLNMILLKKNMKKLNKNIIFY